MSIQSNFPSVRPALLLDFANTKQLDPRITFTRASTANYYDGKTATLAEQNLLIYSEQFDNAAWTKLNSATVTANSTVAPDGTTTADTITDSSTSLYMGVQQFYPAVSGAVYTGSIYVKRTSTPPGFFPLFQVATVSQSTWCGLIIDTTKGTVSVVSGGPYVAPTSYVVVAVGDYLRVTLSVTSSSTGLNGFELYPAASQNGTSISATATGSTVFWGAQLETRSTVSAYTATTSVPITNYIPTLQSAASGVARFDSNPTTGESLGLLIEESRTNLALASGQLETIAWTKDNISLSANCVVAPDGTLAGDKIFPTASTATHDIYQIVSVTSGSSYTFSCYAKQAEMTRLCLVYYDGGSSFVTSIFSLSAGTVLQTGTGNTATIISVGDGWYRCSITRSAQATGNCVLYVFPINADSFTYPATYTGDGYSGIYIWGAQFEAGSSATSYVATPLTFTSRASSATYLGPNGYITSASTNVARNQTNSVGTTNLLLESAASNLVTYTDDFGNGAWSKDNVVVAPNIAQSPDGLIFGDVMVENSNTLTNYRVRQSLSLTGGTAYTASVYVKPLSRQYLHLFAYSATYSSNMQAFFDLSGNGAYTLEGSTPSASITPVGGGWYRCTVTGTPAGTGTYTLYIEANSTYPSGAVYTGTVGLQDFAMWGAQVEAGSTATSYIPSVETFSGRSSSGTYYNSSGVLATASSGTSRTTYNPALLGAGGKLLLEPAATNLALYSEQFENWTNAAGSVTTNTTTAPDGNTTADTLTGSRYEVLSLASNTYTLSCYAKANNGDNTVAITIYDNSLVGSTGIFNLASGTVTTTPSGFTATIQPINNGWYRCSITGVIPAKWIGIASANSGTNSTYVWGGQLETGSGATSYIVTTSSQVTRAADTSTSAAQSRSADVYSASTVTRAADAASMTGTNFSSWYSGGAGTLYSEYSTLANLGASTTACPVEMNDGTQGKYFQPGPYTLATQTANTFTRNATSLSGGQSNAYVARGGSYLGSYNYSGDTSLSETGLTQLQLGQARISYPVSAVIKKVAYYPTAVTTANIQALTS